MRLPCLAALLLSLVPLVTLADCDAAKAQDAQSRDLEGAARVAAYRQIVGLCGNFNYQYKLGRALQETAAHDAARQAYERARETVGDKRAEGLLYGRLAETYLALGRVGDAVAAADAAANLTAPDSPDWLHKVRRAADERLAAQPVSTEAILQGLRATRSFKVQPRVNLHVVFRSFHDSLTEEGEAQVAEVGRALARLPEKTRVRLIGHTDGGAGDFVALRLSSTRAERVAETVIAAHPQLAGRITSEGHGGKEPRHTGDDDATRRLNRRVEMVLSE